MENETISIIALIVTLVFLSGLFSAMETAFSSFNRIKIKNLAEKGSKQAALVIRLASNFDDLLSTILVGNNILNISLASISAVFFVKNFGPDGLAISSAVITTVVLIFGEMTPKSLAKENAEKFAMFSAPLLHILIVLLTPINFLFAKWKSLLSLLTKKTKDHLITEEDLLIFVEEAEQEGAINIEDKNLIHNAIEFNDSTVKDILTPRIDIVGVPLDFSIADIKNIFLESEYSRIPVFDGSLDKIIGIIHLKNFFKIILDENSSKNIHDIISPAVFTTPTTKISKLIKLLQKEKSLFAVVIDEFGGTAGIVTLEDILEELVGEIWDEHDEVIYYFEMISPNQYKVSGKFNIEDMFDFFKLSVNTKSSTVNGWVIEKLGRMPEKGDEFYHENLFIKVNKVNKKRIAEIIITVKNN